MVMCRVLEVDSGRVTIDGVDVAGVGVRELRERITVIPQEPVVFNNTLRFNLDPEGRKADEEILQVVRKA